ncbi:hypothetical protein K466DRAFT_603008 [Polyporus arcularius HHB13444]|uniref:Uncharacterized protein n=1 Tax=Polyporus arcularius HHB13444 TaxID=1314778 RepID=A0A5C3P2M7_9APHY|nr:hypothetical protein K466DRAFT_603008 [Polyporus arcularius HHB13444]
MSLQSTVSPPAHPWDVFVDFTETEVFWREHQDFLYSRGYTLRHRYRLGWVPSWRQDPTIRLLDAEDRLSFWLGQSHLMDARRLTDRMLVSIKKVRTDSRELQIATFLSSATLRRDPRNHCVPIPEVLRDPKTPPSF